MQNKISKQARMLAVCFLIGILQSCSDITEMQREYLDRGEQIYAGKIDSVKVRGGLERVQIEGLSLYARSNARCYVSWDDQLREYAMSDIIRGEKVEILIPDIPEGSYYFYVQTEDKDGNKSLRVETSGFSYGEEYKLSKIKKRITDQKAEPSKLILFWGSSEDAVKVDFTYDNSSGGKTTLELPGNIEKLEITDWVLGGEMVAVTYTVPEKNALDTIALDPVVLYFMEEVEYEVDKANFKSVLLPTDIKGNAYSGKPEGIWDGIKGSGSSNRYHSGDGEGVPHHLTFDMGVQAHLTRFEIVGRENHHNWNPKRFQIWGIDSLDGAETTLHSSDPDWEKEAMEKGWKLLSEETNEDPVTNVYQINESLDDKVRYIRYRVLEVFGDGITTTGTSVYGAVQELTFWSDDITD